jgi:hypothetical protein
MLRPLLLTQGLPGAMEELGAPDLREGRVLARRRRPVDRLGDLDGPAQGSAAGSGVDDQPVEGRLEEVAEPALFRVGPAEVAAEELQREVLEEVVGQLAVAGGAQEVAVDRGPIPLQDLGPGRGPDS